MERTILKLLENNARLTANDIAEALKISEKEALDTIEKLENAGVINGYKAVINWDKYDENLVSALIDLKVSPQAGQGFDRVAEKIQQYDHVKNVYLLSSGRYDIHLLVEGKSLKEVANFVSQKLAPMDCVTETSTHFILKRYKDGGIVFNNDEHDNRQVVTL